MKSCPKCNMDNLDSNRNCINCGASLIKRQERNDDFSNNSLVNKKSDSSQRSRKDVRIPELLRQYDYGEDRIPFLKGSVIAISVVMALIGLGLGIFLWDEIDETSGVITIIVGVLVAFVVYLFLTCFVHIYENITVIARNTQIQAAYIHKYAPVLDYITEEQGKISSNLDAVNCSVNELCAEYKINAKKVDAQLNSLAGIESAQEQIIANQVSAAEKIDGLKSDTDSLCTNCAAESKANQSFREKLLSAVGEYRLILEALPNRLRTLISDTQSDSTEADKTEKQSDE